MSGRSANFFTQMLLYNCATKNGWRVRTPPLHIWVPFQTSASFVMNQIQWNLSRDLTNAHVRTRNSLALRARATRTRSTSRLQLVQNSVQWNHRNSCPVLYTTSSNQLASPCQLEIKQLARDAPRGPLTSWNLGRSGSKKN